MRYDVDRIGNVRGGYTQTLRKMPDGSTKIDDTEKHWPADLILLAIGFVGTENTVPNTFDLRTEQNKIVANEVDYTTNQPHIFTAGDARRGQSLVVWAIKEGRGAAKSVHRYLQKQLVLS